MTSQQVVEERRMVLDRHPHMAVKNITKWVRQDLKEALAAGELGDIPEGVKLSVTTGHGSSIDVTIMGVASEWLWQYGHIRQWGCEGWSHTEAAVALKQAVDEIRDRYDQTSGDPYADYGLNHRYSGGTQYDYRIGATRGFGMNFTTAQTAGARLVVQMVATVEWTVEAVSPGNNIMTPYRFASAWYKMPYPADATIDDVAADEDSVIYQCMVATGPGRYLVKTDTSSWMVELLEPECEGHAGEDGTLNGPMGEVTYCDGSCVTTGGFVEIGPEYDVEGN